MLKRKSLINIQKFGIKGFCLFINKFGLNGKYSEKDPMWLDLMVKLLLAKKPLFIPIEDSTGISQTGYKLTPGQLKYHERTGMG